MKGGALFAVLALTATASTPLSAQIESVGVVRGYVTGSDDAERLAGAVVYVKDSPHTTVANSSGFYELVVPEGMWIISAFHARGQELGLEGAPSALVAVWSLRATRNHLYFNILRFGQMALG